MNAPIADEYAVTNMYPGHWGVGREGDERFVVTGDQEQVEYAAMLLNAGMDEEEVREASTRTQCVRCGRTVFVGQVDSSMRCPDDQS